MLVVYGQLETAYAYKMIRQLCTAMFFAGGCVFFFASCCDYCPTSEQIVKGDVVLHIINKTTKRWMMTVKGVSRIYVTWGKSGL